jgi:sugar lactone lactonase YvrE
MTFNAAGHLLIGSLNDNDVAEFDGTNGGVVRKFFDACPTSLASPVDVAVGPDGNVYVTCAGSDAVHRFTPTGSPLGFFVTGGSGGLTNPQGLAFGPNGNLFVASGIVQDFEILQYNGTTGAFVNVFVDSGGNGGGAMTPYGLTFHGGDLYVASRYWNEVKRFNGTTGAFVSTFVTSGSGGLSGPTAVEFGPDENLYVSSYNDNTIRRYNGTTGAFLSTFVSSGSGGLDGPIDFGFHPALQGPANIPTLSGVGLSVLLAALAFAGARWARRLPRSSR